MPTAQVVTITEKTNGPAKSVIFDWTCTDLGVVASTTTASFDGPIEAVMFVPDTSTTAPDDQYDATLTDGTNDLLFGQGANLSGTNSIAILSNLGWCASKQLTLNITGAGDANGGLVYVYIR